ncbi:hypothetical protein RDI58_002628 [Solanum bulbocastanum]|uniref:N-acetyltransferase domain-containing protein n=1 Tax=Solanum bulbocastanum TaxID=147425 RepID=A0AAN8U710_SOLBU
MDSSRITLRLYRSTDVDDVLSWASDDRITRSTHFSTLTSKEDALNFIDKSSIPWRRSICIDDRSIGMVVARPGSGDDRCRAEIGYVLGVEYWGQGITPEAVKMAIPLILEEFPEIVRLQALSNAEHKASHRVLEKAGFIKDDMDSSRISLRPFKLTDVDDMMLWAGDDRVTQTIRWNTFTSKGEALTFIKDVCIPHPWRRSICIDDRSIGFVSVFPGSGDDRNRADVGYAVAFEYWGQGIGTEAVKMTVPQVYSEFPEVIRLQALVDVENKASQRVLEKVGFIKEGKLRKYGYHKGKLVDLFMYSLLSTESIY